MTFKKVDNIILGMKSIISTQPIKLTLVAKEPMFAYVNNTIAILFCADGQTNVSINNTHFRMKSGDIILVNSMEMYSVFNSNSVLLVLSLDKTQLKLNEDEMHAYFACNSIQQCRKDKFYNLSRYI